MFDVLTTAAVADELTEQVLDGRIQRVGMLSRMAVGFEVYAGGRRRYLLASAQTDDARVALLDREPSFDTQLVTPLLLLLRKYTRGGVIVGVEQPPLERIVRLSIAKRFGPHNDAQPEAEGQEPERHEDEEDAEGIEDARFVHLVVEVMGRHSNIILIDDEGKIMESVKRVTAAMSRVRQVLPRRPYVDPPAGDRADPRQLTAAAFAISIAKVDQNQPLAKALPRLLRGVSPLIAREVAFHALGNSEAAVREASGDAGAAVVRELRRVLEPLLIPAWSPHLYRDEDGRPAAYAAVAMRHLEAACKPEAVATISKAIELFYADESQPGAGKHRQRRERLIETIGQARQRAESRLEQLRAQAAKGEEAERWRRYGELIYAYLWGIQPGQSELAVEEERVPLDPSLSGKENAQVYFERYRKAQSAGEHLPALVQAAERELQYLDQLLIYASLAKTFSEIEEIAAEWEQHRGEPHHGHAAGRKPRSTPKRRIRALTDRNGNLIYIGRSGVENDRVAFEIAGPDDTWLHARGVPGSHVVVKWSDPTSGEDEDTIDTAAALAAYYSRNRESGSVEVDVTRRRYVRKIRGTGPGLATYHKERTVAVRPADEAELVRLGRIRG